ncbi:MAG: hypothetical protein PHX04_06565, partial [Bacilli bacterium]|nr:hypothetical protein [Bacilli bacterium]
QILNKNKNVIMVKYGKQIEYKNSFKNWAVLQSLNHPEMSAIQLFEKAGFNRNIIRSRSAESRIRYWKGNYFKNKEIYNENPTIFQNESLEKQNNTLILLLISKFESLINVLSKRL